MNMLRSLLGIFGGNAYRWEDFNLSQSLRQSGTAGATRNLKGRKKSIYRKWGFNNSPDYVNLSKAQRKGKTFLETKKMRVDIFRGKK